MGEEIKNIGIIEVTADNIEKEHIGCAIGNTGDAKLCSDAKKAWMRQNFEAGYHFWRLDARGKALIEATPAQHAWAPVQADNWLFIDCFWVSGQFKGHGVARRLLEKATTHAKAEGMHGLVAVASVKKRAFLSEQGFYAHLGFEKVDGAAPDFVLMALPFDKKAPLPRFIDNADKLPRQDGIFIWYSSHCPHAVKYVDILRKTAAEKGVPFTSVQLQSAQQAREVPCPFTTWVMFHDGKFVTNEIFSPGKLQKYLETIGK